MRLGGGGLLLASASASGSGFLSAATAAAVRTEVGADSGYSSVAGAEGAV